MLFRILSQAFSCFKLFFVHCSQAITKQKDARSFEVFILIMTS